MRTMDRRRFVQNSAALAVSVRSMSVFAQSAASSTGLVKLGAASGAVVPHNFLGLSYEVQQLSDPNFFSPANTALIAQFRALAPHGVLRLGGNTSDVGWWKPTPESTMPPLPANVTLIVPEGERSPLDLAYPVTPKAVENLRGFLDATGWTCLYGINLGTNTPELAAEQGAFVVKTLGPKLEYFQVGNEPDLFPSRFRVKADWNPDVYMTEWLAAVNAIRAKAPEARFGLPDVASKVEWFDTVAKRLGKLTDGPKVVAVSHHYYFSGPPSNPNVNIERLLKPDPKVKSAAATASGTAKALHTAWRMTEGNTCYRGGKPGVSDVFAASLWAADYLLTLASLGYAGVNLHGGDGKMVADSLGGRLPGDDLVKDDPASHPHPYYTPIAHIGERYVAEPVFFGMRFAGEFAGATLVPVTFDPGAVNATAYAGVHPRGARLLAVINKDASQDLTVSVDGVRFEPAWVLSAPSLSSTAVTFEPAKGHGMIVKAGSAVIFRASK